ncbi:hypothetical protein NP233_g4930 [Leucocoprinus birnbaumii]|uniref:RING-type domain-containing protein n=1 Tax=Leucocoprinus birnbaumii TaxID=56174 RepID=A0AAD5YX60_9AGAR|nr:hypothetical protein NP233_g4930 [Leucocoprinus birnbaumii]
MDVHVPSVTDRLHPLFASPDGDVILSARGGQTFFRVHTYTLKTTSGFFRAMYNLPQSKSPVDNIIYLDDDAEVLEPLLRMVCGLELPRLTDYDLIEKILFVAEKYEMPGPISILRLLASTEDVLSHPLRLYSFACRYGWEEEAKLASNRTLKLDLFAPCNQETLQQLPSKALLDLLNLRHRRREQLRGRLDNPPFVSGATANCVQCDNLIEYHTWRELKYKILEEMDRRPLGDTILESGLADWPEAKACWRAKCSKKDCGRLLYDKGETLRSPPRGTRAQSRTSPLAQKPASKRQASSEVLELSSSDDTPLHPLSKHAKPKSTLTVKKRTKPKPKIPLSTAEVIEISSDEDDVPLSQESLIADLRNQVKKLKQESERHQETSKNLMLELSRSRAELAKASEHPSTDGKLVLDHSEIDDSLNCEICTRRMYTPYLLPDCGHTFCLSCLRDWFGTAHARFVQAHPQQNQNVRDFYVQRITTLLRPEFIAHPQVADQLQQLQQPTPEFTCPTCRKRAYRRPIEVYALKSLVRAISAVDEEEKANIPPDQPFVERRQGRTVVVDPWEGFFPRES